MLKQIIELEEEIQIRKETKWVIRSPISNILTKAVLFDTVKIAVFCLSIKYVYQE